MTLGGHKIHGQTWLTGGRSPFPMFSRVLQVPLSIVITIAVSRAIVSEQSHVEGSAVEVKLLGSALAESVLSAIYARRRES